MRRTASARTSSGRNGRHHARSKFWNAIQGCAGAIVGVFLLLMLMGADQRAVMLMQLTGADEAWVADVVRQDGVNRMATTGLVSIETLFGNDPKATNWFFIGTADDADGVGAENDTVRVQIPAAASPLDVLYPAVDVTTTVTAAMVAASNPERALADKICSDLNGDTNFNVAWECDVMSDFSGVFIESIIFNEFGDRTSFTVTATGTTSVTLGNGDGFQRRGLATELARSPNNPRQGVLGVSGSINIGAQAATDLFTEKAQTTGGSDDLTVDCDPFVAATCEFFIDADPINEKVIQFLTFSGTANGIKYGQFLSQGSKLTNGMLIEVKSNNVMSTFEVIDATDDFEDSWSNVPNEFRLSVQAGGDHFNGTKNLIDSPIVLKPQGSFATDDYVKITVRDDLTSISEMNMRVKGFEKSP